MRLLVLSLLLVAGCAQHLPPELELPPQFAAVTSGGMNRSAMFLFRVDGGIVLVDLGWWGADDALEAGLSELGATTDDVIAVFLTHSHRDHMAAWRRVRHAPFHVAEAEVELLFGEEQHGGWIPRWAGKVSRGDLPAPGDVEVRAFSSDTSFGFGRDTLRAFLVPGHTAGSSAYLFRGMLLAGDAVAHTWASAFRPALPGYSRDVQEARSSLESLRGRVASFPVSSMCTAHMKCSMVSEAFWADLLEE